MNENDLILSVSIANVSFSVEGGVLSTEVSDEELGVSIISLLLKSLTGDEGRWWSRLLENPLDDCVLGSTSSVFRFLTIPFRTFVIRIVLKGSCKYPGFDIFKNYESFDFDY